LTGHKNCFEPRPKRGFFVMSATQKNFGKKLPHAFFTQPNVLKIAKNILGKILVTNFNGITTAARIVEAEAYNGITDKASHAFGSRRTARTQVMYQCGGVAYVYLCYGIHHLFNVVTNVENIPHAILIRAGEPLAGIDEMLLRTKKQKPDATLTRGPGNLAKALGISTAHSGVSLQSNEIYICDDGFKITTKNIVITPRIGVDYAGADAQLPYRFYLKGNKYVSG
jgi:DNA-3-methyladenine glycosylase